MIFGKATPGILGNWTLARGTSSCAATCGYFEGGGSVPFLAQASMLASSARKVQV